MSEAQGALCGRQGRSCSHCITAQGTLGPALRNAPRFASPHVNHGVRPWLAAPNFFRIVRPGDKTQPKSTSDDQDRLAASSFNQQPHNLAATLFTLSRPMHPDAAFATLAPSSQPCRHPRMPPDWPSSHHPGHLAATLSSQPSHLCQMINSSRSSTIAFSQIDIFACITYLVHVGRRRGARRPSWSPRSAIPFLDTA